MPRTPRIENLVDWDAVKSDRVKFARVFEETNNRANLSRAGHRGPAFRLGAPRYSLLSSKEPLGERGDAGDFDAQAQARLGGLLGCPARRSWSPVSY